MKYIITWYLYIQCTSNPQTDEFGRVYPVVTLGYMVCLDSGHKREFANKDRALQFYEDITNEAKNSFTNQITNIKLDSIKIITP